MEVEVKAKKAKEASRKMAVLDTETKNRALINMAEALLENADKILKANEKDVLEAERRNLKASLVDRLKLDEKRIKAMAEGLKEVASLKDPVGDIEEMWIRPNGLQIGKMRVPIGVIGMIYESRPNVTADAAGLCLKAGNAVILRGGSDAINSNIAIASILAEAAYKSGIPEGAIQLIENTDREEVNRMMKLNGLIDLIIPRGGTSLIKNVIENSTVPVIETGVGNCHIFVDESANFEMAKDIIVNAKVQRPGVCNAVETVLVHKGIAERFLPVMVKELSSHGVEIRGCELTKRICPDVKEATEEDWATEYLDLILAVKVVENIDEALEHISKYSTGHSESIVTENYTNAMRFLKSVDSAAVYVNASTRFTDGGEFGFGAEIGISTQKMHARGPMGLKELTTYKYVILGSGQIRK
ncbi:MAG: Gamma-glutamyl phosphate reductase [Caldanaerobacter subterraneus]|uniref:Gamma-glutamyl phosphate reductase n=4 Tax=Caldanaerobacter subterraneus TaxID=911092 RepID=PROA_CALS4|nr:glutamate-5-semialdehyde dehydrogenase [Caldanaerobacter subterraneus]Q8RAE5.1 RecName: Full=Gamma-glutamyl phosphate reductase; Short=GPR; AltName: Full=Glutamate-5-semialdehyde dehydrogenase; AltName: Full=Glutamyl-gamma-semialdehyde dehydrogenase; Short=GSA dehydrogenase [Caldanaerobacter subterraneus subsp. tengcongensis MB4]AAM24502.1 Gamma-glutamyl phosphate reductase [Caldanaerobacter subterraneus subsp. tengcongensis MB4]KKC29757.1 gamma-glutamyl phosphate reductase [Caldanaerobacter 